MLRQGLFTLVLSLILAAVACADAPDLVDILTGNPDNGFGRAVCISGGRAAVGCPQTNGIAGAVQVYDVAPSASTVSHALLGEAGYDRFGTCVDMDGDRLLVGAFTANVPGYTDAGKAYAYDLSVPGTTPTHVYQGKVLQEEFGTDVAVSGTTALVGAPRYATPEGDPYVGRAYQFDLANPNTEPVAYATGPGAHSTFGYSVAVDGSRAVVGAGGDQSEGPGAAYGFTLPLGAADMTMSGEEDEDRCGWSCDVDGRYGAVGAVWAGDEVNAGKVYVYDMTSPLTAPKVFETDLAGDNFGCSLAVEGELLLVGAYLADDGDMEEAGKAFLYHIPSQALLWTFRGDAANDGFGCGVDMEASQVIIGTFSAGKAYIYDIGRIPEPATLSVLVLGAAAALTRRRR